MSARTFLRMVGSVLVGLMVFVSTASAEETVRTESVIYRKTPQAELKLTVHYPPQWKATDARPSIVFFFGGGWSGGTPEQFLKQADYLATRGMVAARADYRVKTRHNVTPDECVRDAQAAIRYVREHSAKLGIDPQRIVAAGGSAGGHLAACTGCVPPLKVDDANAAVSCRANALVLFNPVLKFTGAEQLMSRIANNTELGRAISPTLQLQGGGVPTILFYGTSDVLIEQGREFTVRAKELGVRAELKQAPEQKHGYFNRSPWMERTLFETDEFLASLGYLSGPPTLTRPE